MILKTRWFQLLIGPARWLQGFPFTVRLQWRPIYSAATYTFRPIPCRWDGWINRYGWRVFQRDYKEVGK